MKAHRSCSGSFGNFRLLLSAVAVAASALLLAPAAGADDGAVAAELPAHLGTADVANGEKLYMRNCRACHTNTKDGANKTGPNLWNIVGRQQGAKDGFRYSKELAAMEGRWGVFELNTFLAKPMDYIPGIRMAFPGLKKDSDRVDLIAYLRTLSDDPMPLSLN